MCLEGRKELGQFQAKWASESTTEVSILPLNPTYSTNIDPKSFVKLVILFFHTEQNQCIK